MLLVQLFLFFSPLISAACYFRDGSTATHYKECPNSKSCCPEEDTCLDNGLCQDKNNHDDGSLADLDGTWYNYTGLYYTSICQDRSFGNCFTKCVTSDMNTGNYIWSCNSALTSYCCHDSTQSLARGDCCSNTTFSLASGVPLSEKQTSTQATTSATATSTTSTASTAATSTSSSSNASSTTSNARLSAGAIAGVAVGAGAAAIIIVILVILLMRSRQNAARQSQQSIPQEKSQPDITQGSLGQTVPKELWGSQISDTKELPANDLQIGELPAKESAAKELPARQQSQKSVYELWS